MHVRLWNLGPHVCIEVDQLKEEIRIKMINLTHTIINLHADLSHYKTCYNCPKTAVVERGKGKSGKASSFARPCCHWPTRRRILIILTLRTSEHVHHCCTRSIHTPNTCKQPGKREIGLFHLAHALGYLCG